MSWLMVEQVDKLIQLLPNSRGSEWTNRMSWLIVYQREKPIVH